eukprot:4369393-Pleurochrysis_carterae.AAC.1
MGTIEGRGRWGRVESLAAAADIREGLGQLLAGLLSVLHVMAGGGMACGSVDFYMVELARRACLTEGGGRPRRRCRGRPCSQGAGWASPGNMPATPPSAGACEWQASAAAAAASARVAVSKVEPHIPPL